MNKLNLVEQFTWVEILRVRYQESQLNDLYFDCISGKEIRNGI